MTPSPNAQLPSLPLVHFQSTICIRREQLQRNWKSLRFLSYLLCLILYFKSCSSQLRTPFIFSDAFKIVCSNLACIFYCTKQLNFDWPRRIKRSTALCLSSHTIPKSRSLFVFICALFVAWCRVNDRRPPFVLWHRTAVKILSHMIVSQTSTLISSQEEILFIKNWNLCCLVFWTNFTQKPT